MRVGAFWRNQSALPFELPLENKSTSRAALAPQEHPPQPYLSIILHTSIVIASDSENDMDS